MIINTLLQARPIYLAKNYVALPLCNQHTLMKRFIPHKNMKRKFFLLSSLLLSASLHAVPISGVINSYAGVSAIAGINLTVSNTAGFTVGDKIMIIQMKGAGITTSNTASYGDITSYNDAGNFEFNYIAAIAFNTITIQSNLVKTYTAPSGLVQIINVPFFCDADITDTLKAQPWDGSTGGVLIFESGGTVTMNADIYVSGAGFRIPPACNNGIHLCSNLNYYLNPNNCNAGIKGEGIAAYVNNNQSGGRAKLANGGGGSNRANSGGGGGANYGAGGFGGYEDNICGANTIQGIGGAALDYTLGKIFMGGAGGNGQGNDGGAIFSGGNGGGIVIIAANTIVTNGYSIWNDGIDVTGQTVNEGAGGGGGGGVVCLDVLTVTGALTVSVTGGDGGSTNNVLPTADCTGPGGGGGGGTVWVSGAVLNPNIVVNANAGLAGLALGAGTSCVNTTYGAVDGNAGAVIFNYPPHVLPTPAVIANLGPDVAACPLQPVNLDPGFGFASYLWQDGSIDTFFTAIGAGTYFVKVSDNQGCFSADTIQITLAPPFVFTIGLTGDTIICPGQTVTINPGLYTSYLWQDSSTNSTFVTIDTGTYTVSVVDSFGCIGSSTFQIYHIPPFTYTIGTGSAIVCPYQPVVIDAGPGYATYIWEDSSSNQTFVTTDTGTFIVTVIDTDGCIGTGSFQVFYFPNSNVFIGNDTSFCEGDTIFLNAGIFPAYLWQDGSQNAQFTVTDTGTYSVIVIDFNYCVIGDTIDIKPYYPVPPANLVNDTLICTGEVVTIKAPPGYLTYEWSDGSTLNFIDIDQPGTYSLTVTNQFTCKGVDPFNVTLQCPTAIFVPDAFTPNGDGVNDIFTPIGYNIKSYFMEIYNRWGIKVFETNNIDKGWNGDCGQVPCETATYVYYIVWTGSLYNVFKGGTERGNVTLIR